VNKNLVHILQELNKNITKIEALKTILWWKIVKYLILNLILKNDLSI
jgi:hypothetical protein